MEGRIAFLRRHAHRWMAAQRELHRGLASPLPDTTRLALRGYFEAETLDRTLVRRVPVIENPAFYRAFEEAGEAIPLDFRVWAGITFGDVILVSDSQVPGPPPHSVIFHEMVHVVQYSVLGIKEFARRYVEGLALNRFQYMTLPLETNAFDLQDKFEKSQGVPFSAEAEIRAEFGASEPAAPVGREGRRPNR